MPRASRAVRGWPSLAILVLLASGCAQPAPAPAISIEPTATSSETAVPEADPCDPGDAPPTQVPLLHGNESQTARAALGALGLSGESAYNDDGWFRTYRLNDTITSFQDLYGWHPRLWNLDRAPLAIEGGLDGFLQRYGMTNRSAPRVEPWTEYGGSDGNSGGSGSGASVRIVGVLFHQEVAGRPIVSSRGTFRSEGTDLNLGKAYAIPDLGLQPDHGLLARAASFVRCQLDRLDRTEAEGYRMTAVHSGETDVVDGRLVQTVGFTWAGDYPCGNTGVLMLWQDLGTGDLIVRDEAKPCFAPDAAASPSSFDSSR